MRLLPLLRTVLWAALLGSPLRGGSSLRHAVYWNSSNPRLLQGDAVVEVGLNDYLDIFCPHYEGPGPPEGPETFALYMVDWPGYKACRAEGPGAFKRWEWAFPFPPFGPVPFSEKIQRFTPFSLGFEFVPGETYYYILVPTPQSPGQCLRLQVSVCCKERKSGSEWRTRRLRREGYTVQVNVNDYLDIYCPHYNGSGVGPGAGPGPGGGAEQYVLYMCLRMKVFVCCASTSHSGEKPVPTLPQFTMGPNVKINVLEDFEGENPQVPKLEKSISGTSPKREHLPLAVGIAFFLLTLLAS
ncbi:Ephrin-A4 [Tupaia chinensis]|uniref:Ephrin-A4 n=2 Tax=Tupaia chinensis TaxID=246437 RepID=L9KIB1_TUPCH|nr:Ephrin-A4 [Tupaia chinensis]